MNPLKFFLDDPMYPELVETTRVPDQNPMFFFQVDGFTAGEFPLDTPEGRAANCYAAIALGISRFLQIRVGGPIHWSRVQTVMVRPAAGQNWNAFYDRKSLNFFFNWDDLRKRMVYAASSPRIVTHELGHGLLDAMRPDFWGLSSMFEVWAIHEAFGDIFSFACALSHDEVLKRALSDTNNDLGQPNLISGLAQEFFMGLNKLPIDQRLPLRDAAQFFSYVDPASLPKIGTRDQLIREAHSFSRVFSGMVYDFFVRVYRKKMATMPPFQAAQEAMGVAIHYVIATAAYVAVRADFFDSYARCMLFIDFQAGQPYSQELYAAFSARNILHDVKVQEVQPEPHSPPALRVSTRDGHSMQVYKKRGTVVVSHEPGIHALDYNPLYDLEVEVAMDRHREYDKFQNLAVDDYASHKATVDAVAVTLDILHEKNLVGNDVHQPYRIEGNKLVRKHFAC